MSDNKPGEQEDGARKDPQIGLSLPEEETRHRSGAGQRRPRAGAHARLRRAVQIDESVAARWLLPLAALFLVLLVILAALHLSQDSRVDALQRQVELLNERIADTGSGAAVERLAARLESLGERLNAVDEAGAGLENLRSTIAEQTRDIEALTDRVADLEQAPASGTGDSRGADSQGAHSGSDPAAGNGWQVNLITVADRAAAENIRQRLDDAGVDSHIQSVTVEDKTLLRVVVPGFRSRDGAENAGAELKRRLELSEDPWITQQ